LWKEYGQQDQALIELAALPVIAGKRQGAKDYLTKPVDEDVLLQTVDRMLADG